MTSEKDSIVVIGAGHASYVDDQPCDPLPFLKTKKLRKYMGRQDDMAVVASGVACQNNAALAQMPRDRIGLFLAVGYIPFQRRDLMRLAEAANDDGAFSMQRLSTSGYHAVNGLLTFQCLPNMPAFHISNSLDIQGPCFVTYPGIGQFYVALEQACNALHDQCVDAAIISGVADQRNFLVQHHHMRLKNPVPASTLGDAAGSLVLKRHQDVTRDDSVLARLAKLNVGYEPFDPFQSEPTHTETYSTGDATAATLVDHCFGAASLAVLLCRTLNTDSRSLSHRVRSRDGIHATSDWELS